MTRTCRSSYTMLSGARESKMIDVSVSWICMCSSFKIQFVHPQTSVRSGFQSSSVNRDGRFTKPSQKSPLPFLAYWCSLTHCVIHFGGWCKGILHAPLPEWEWIVDWQPKLYFTLLLYYSVHCRLPILATLLLWATLRCQFYYAWFSMLACDQAQMLLLLLWACCHHWMFACMGRYCLASITPFLIGWYAHLLACATILGGCYGDSTA